MISTRSVLSVVMLCTSLGAPALASGPVVDIRELGAKPDGKTPCTRAIQAAVDKCASAGGGTVYLPAGKWLSGTIYMKSHVTLLLAAGCVLLASTDPGDYPENVPAIRSYTDRYVRQSLIAGEDLEHIAVRGRGTIDGNGQAFRWREYKNRPYLIRFVHCRDVLVEGVTLRNSAMWMQHYLACQRVRIMGVTVWNHVTYNNDGLDIDGCHDVIISNCVMDTDDDALCLKSTLDRACENVTVSNCILSSHCNAIKMGTESIGGFRNIAIDNCSVISPRYTKPIYGRQRGLAGIALEIVDGGTLEHVVVSNIAIRGVSVPIFMRLGNRGRRYQESMPKPPVGVFRNVTLSSIVAGGTGNIGCSITGLEGHPIENVTLRDVNLGFEGGGGAAQADVVVPEKEESYPESTMFGTLPAYGFYCRHVQGVRFQNVRLRTEKPDQRHALVCDDVTGLVIDGLDTPCAADARPVIRLTQARDVLIHGCRPQGPLGTFLQLGGDQTQGVILAGNDLRRAKQIAQLAEEVPHRALVDLGNVMNANR
ncbi:MAG TPA: glycoside hydrolase family 28 protein [Planctomycetes bacterium]|nr:glycoside hydrolase family 28 protein [Planctomycetota bacterium]